MRATAPVILLAAYILEEDVVEELRWKLEALERNRKPTSGSEKDEGEDGCSDEEYKSRQKLIRALGRAHCSKRSSAPGIF